MRLLLSNIVLLLLILPIFAQEFSLVNDSVNYYEIPNLDSLKGLNDPVLAYGVSNIKDWSVAAPFLDISKQGRDWGSTSSWGERFNYNNSWRENDFKDNGYLDENGWITSMPSEVQWASRFNAWTLEYNMTPIEGRYVIKYEGEGEINSWNLNSNDVAYYPNENKAIFNLTSGRSWAFQIRNTTPGNHIRNITVIRDDRIHLYEAGILYNPDYIDIIKDARLLRFMGAMDANGNDDEIEWSDRTTPSYYRWRDGYPVEVMVDLSNTIQVDPWFTLGHRVDDNYVREFATYVRDNLDSDLTAHIELSNEVWNWQFSQTHYYVNKGKDEWDNGQVGEYYVKRASEVMQIWDDVYENESDERIVKVLGGQAVNDWLTEVIFLDASAWKENEPEEWVDPTETFDAFALTTYFGGRILKNDTIMDQFMALPEDEAFEYFLEEMEKSDRGAEDVIKWLSRQKEVINETGWDLIVYEGGQHVHHYAGKYKDNESYNERMRRFIRSEHMADLYQILWDDWKKIGDGPFMQFETMGTSGKFGSWGLYENLFDSSPRQRLLEELNANTNNWWGDEVSDVYQHGKLYYHAQKDEINIIGTKKIDHLIGNSLNNTFYPGPGDDRIHGMGGFNLVLFSGNYSDYEIKHNPVLNNNNVYIVDGVEGKTQIANISVLQFNDMSISVNGTKLKRKYSNISMQPAPIINLVFNSTNIRKGESVELTWSISYATSCTNKDDLVHEIIPFENSITLSPSETSTYTLNCTGFSGESSKTVIVEVSNEDPLEDYSNQRNSPSSGGGGSRSSSNDNSPSTNTNPNSASDKVQEYLDSQSCISNLEKSEWSICEEGVQERSIKDLNFCQEFKTETRACTSNNNKENSILNAREVNLTKNNDFSYNFDFQKELLKSSNEEELNSSVSKSIRSIKVKDRLSSRNTVIIEDNSSNTLYLARLIDEDSSSSSYYYELEEVSEASLTLLEQEKYTQPQREIREINTQNFQENLLLAFKDRGNLIRLGIVTGFMFLLTSILYIKFRIKVAHSKGFSSKDAVKNHFEYKN